MDQESVPTFDNLNELTSPAVERQQTLEFAGFLTREEDDTVFIADEQGTWAIPREGIAFLEDWENSAQCAPEHMHSKGRPVRVGVEDGTTILELRPWRMRRPGAELTLRNIRREVEIVFTLGGSSLPIGEQTTIGEEQLAALERAFARQLGWDPDSRDPTKNLRQNPLASSHSQTCTDDECWWGWCDAD